MLPFVSIGLNWRLCFLFPILQYNIFAMYLNTWLWAVAWVAFSVLPERIVQRISEHALYPEPCCDRAGSDGRCADGDHDLGIEFKLTVSCRKVCVCL